MPLWISLNIIAGVVGSISNIFYRTTLKDDQDAVASTWILQASRLALAIFLMVWLSISLTLSSIVILSVLGAIEVFGMYAYMRMHAASALSVSAIVQRSKIFWTAILAAIFVGETFTPMQVGGLLILFLGVSAVAAPHKLRNDKGVQFAYISAILFSITSVMIKATIGSIPPAAQIAGLAFPSVIVFPLVTKGFRGRVKQFLVRRTWMKLFAAFTNAIQVSLTIYALAVGPAAKGGAIFQGSLVLSVFAGIILLGEREDLGRKLLGSLLVIIGIGTMSI